MHVTVTAQYKRNTLTIGDALQKIKDVPPPPLDYQWTIVPGGDVSSVVDADTVQRAIKIKLPDTFDTVQFPTLAMQLAAIKGVVEGPLSTGLPSPPSSVTYVLSP